MKKLTTTIRIAAFAGSLAGLAGDGSERMKQEVLIYEDFSIEGERKAENRISSRHEWWAEGGERAWIEDGRLHMKADPEEANDPRIVSTVWCKTPISGNVRIELKAHVVSSSIGANNINVFFFYSDPEGKPLFDSRESRADGAYSHYHSLNGYIVTFLSDYRMDMGEAPGGHPHARLRLRRCPGFNLVNETYNEDGVKSGRTYDLTIERRDGTVTVKVDGERYLEWEDPDPLKEGLLGLRTFRTHLWWDDIRVTRLE